MNSVPIRKCGSGAYSELEKGYQVTTNKGRLANWAHLS